MSATTHTSISTSHGAAPSTRRRVLRVALWVVQILIAAFFVSAAAPKLLGQPMAVEMFAKIGLGQWFRYFTGACEVSGAIGLLVPRLSGLAALGLVGVMVGATITNVFIAPATAPMTIALGVVCGLIAWHRRAQIAELVQLFRR